MAEDRTDDFAAATDSPADGQSQSAGTLLLVEDDYDIRAMLVMILEMEGFRVVRASHGREALGLLQGGLIPDLILLDLMMPVMNGWQFREALKADARLSAIPIIVISGDGRIPAQHMADEVTCFLKKPLNLDELLEKIREYISPNSP